MTASPFLTAREAAAELDIRLESLYAYVSRGLLRSQKMPGERAARYPRNDVEQLKRRRDEHRQPSKVLENALHFGSPVLESAITLIDGGRFYYRGRDAIELAATQSIENVAMDLWLGADQGAAADLFTAELPALPAYEPCASSLETFQSVLPRLAECDPSSFDRRPKAVARTGARLLGQMARIASGGPWQGGVVDTLTSGWQCRQPSARALLESTLILCVDHELNVSTFTARCVASAGSTPYAVVLAGLAALQGPEHGGHTLRVDALLRESGNANGVHAAIAGRLRRGEAVPGYGQTLYPDGDPRFGFLARQLRETLPNAPEIAWLDAIEDAGRELLGEHPTVDACLVLISRVLDLPQDSGLTLFALGRTIGWIAHAIEQYGQGQLIRPRARYTGKLPVGSQEPPRGLS